MKSDSWAEEKIILIGNPNVGKSAIFNLLTGKYVSVSNYPGTTVEITTGTISLNKKKCLVIDTPGVNNLNPLSEDEKVTRDILLKEHPAKVIQVADAKNLRRALLISLQLAEMGLPFLLDLNMEDEARSQGIFINTHKLAEILGVETILTIATQKKGIDRLIRSLENTKPPSYQVVYHPIIEDYLNQIEPLLPSASLSKRSLGLMLLAGDESLKEWLHANLTAEVIAKIELLRQSLQSKFKEPLNYVITKDRLHTADSILEQVMTTEKPDKSSFAARIGQWSVHPLGGIPFLLLILYLTYKFVGEFGAGTLVDFFEGVVFGNYINPWATKLVTAFVPTKFLQDLLVGEYGLITMALSYSIAIVFPIVTTFFLVFGFLEDSGYLPRLAVMVNKLFKMMGLHGKAVLPMVLGLGCDTMATLTSRILESKKERIIVTLLLALAIPCSAQLGVILGMLGALSLKATILWLGVIVGVILIVGYLASLVIPGKGSDFVLELPPIRVPQLSNIIMKTVARIEWYLKEAVPLFILGTLALFILVKLNLLAMIERGVSPIIGGFLGLPPETTSAFILGFLRRDYGAAGLYTLAKNGALDPIQIVVSLVTITLFVPCIANFFIIIKEQGLKVALAMVAFIFPTAFLIGGLLNFILHWAGIGL
jgi:ferrous iron transport protein B